MGAKEEKYNSQPPPGSPKLWIMNESRLPKVSYFQDEFMKSSFLPKYEQKIVRISALCSERRYLDYFCSYFGRNDSEIV